MGQKKARLEKGVGRYILGIYCSPKNTIYPTLPHILKAILCGIDGAIMCF